MSSKLPSRKNVEPLFRIVSDLDKPSIVSSSPIPTANADDCGESTTKTDHFRFRRKAHKSRIPGPARTYVGTIVSRSQSVDDLQAGNDRSSKDKKESVGHLEKVVRSKDHQIAKLVDKITTLFECNSKFAVEHEKLQKEYLQLQQNLKALESIQPKSCETCGQFEQERETLAKENGDLRNDIKMMKILVYRLNVQVERYQDVIREGNKGTTGVVPKVDFVDSSYGGAKDNLNWGPVNSHTLGPLLNAYEETIAEKNDLVQQYEQEFIVFTGKLKQVLEENEKLHKDAEEIKSTQSNWFSERARLQAQVDVFKNKADIQGKRADLAKEKLVEVLKCYEQKIQAQCLDIERLQEAYSRSKGELTSLRNLNNKPEVVVESLKECQKLFEDMKIQHDSEKTRFTDEMNSLKAALSAKNEELSKLQIKTAEQDKVFERQKEINEVLMEKNTALKRSLHHCRQSKEALKTRLKNVVTWGKGVEQRKDQLTDAWRNVKTLQEKIRQRDEQLHALQVRYGAEVEQLQRRLKQREDSLRRILEEKAQFRQV